MFIDENSSPTLRSLYEKGKEEGIKEGMERAADMLDLNYPLCAKWIRKEIKQWVNIEKMQEK